MSDFVSSVVSDASGFDGGSSKTGLLAASDSVELLSTAGFAAS